MLLFFHNGRTAKKQCRQMPALLWTGWPDYFFRAAGSGLIMQAIVSVIGADLGGFADEFGACFEESLFTFFS